MNRGGTAGFIYTVSGFTKEIKGLLEERFPFVWITGEISNCFHSSAGHCYFSLKDDNSLIKCVLFKGQKRNLEFDLENGMEVTAMARLTLYEPRGDYQLVFEHVQPKGAGALQAAFEQLKKRLSAEGLFEERHKKEIPSFPGKVCIITSPKGAAVRDIINVARRRLLACRLEIIPVKVQGDGADKEIARAFHTANHLSRPIPDIIILARGGGSIEDLAAFNSEITARAVFDSNIPVITGVGHETDFTIADFTADLRAPTPSAAAELALPDKAVFEKRVYEQKSLLVQYIRNHTKSLKKSVQDLSSRLKSPKNRVDELKLRITDRQDRMENALKNGLHLKRQQADHLSGRLMAGSPGKLAAYRRQSVNGLHARLERSITKEVADRRAEFKTLHAGLESLNPMAVLQRGYSITRRQSDKRILYDPQAVENGERIETVLAKGDLISKVEK
ncbi:MAG: exodeoxyribonuclease VII large subunit [Desulfarculaceae bacterium]|nr:exodeoxyribonuclease VII large subunit [Desulfarculaceae bacterium]